MPSSASVLSSSSSTFLSSVVRRCLCTPSCGWQGQSKVVPGHLLPTHLGLGLDGSLELPHGGRERGQGKRKRKSARRLGPARSHSHLHRNIVSENTVKVQASRVIPTLLSSLDLHRDLGRVTFEHSLVAHIPHWLLPDNDGSSGSGQRAHPGQVFQRAQGWRGNLCRRLSGSGSFFLFVAVM